MEKLYYFWHNRIKQSVRCYSIWIYFTWTYSSSSHLNSLHLQYLSNCLFLSVSSSCLSFRIYTLARIVNVEKRRDSARGNRYLVELMLMEGGKRLVRLSEYIYLLLHRSRFEEGIESREGTVPSSHRTPSKNPLPSGSSAQIHTTTPWSTSWAKPLLCQPNMLQWRHDVMIHFVVPGTVCKLKRSCLYRFMGYGLYIKYVHNLK